MNRKLPANAEANIKALEKICQQHNPASLRSGWNCTF